MSALNELSDKLNKESISEIQQFLQSLWENKKLILLITLLVMTIAGFYAYHKPAEYEGCILIQVEDKNQDNLKLQQAFGSNSSSAIAFHSALIQSRIILVPIIKEFGLDIALKEKKPLPIIGRWFSSREQIETKLPTNRVLNYLLDHIQVQQFRETKELQTGILQITYRDTDPQRVAAILNRIGELVQAKSMERRSQESAQTLNFLKEQIPIVRGALESAEQALNQYRAKSGKIDIKMITEQMIEKIANIDKQIVESQLLKSTLLQAFTEKYPPIIELDYKIKQLKKLKLQWVKKMKTLPATDQVAINLMRDAKVKNDLYIILLNKIQEMKVISAGTLSDVRILEAATPPESALPAQKSLTLLASLILGVMLGTIVVLGKKTLRRCVTDPTWTERTMNIPNLAVIPYSSEQGKYKKLRHKKLGGFEILAQKFPQDLSVEALRSLRTSFTVFMSKGEKKVINITGVSSGVGKSFVSLNFACLLADMGKKVLLMDGDLRRGDLHSFLHLTRSPGLNELITQRVSLSKAVKTTKVANLFFIPSGAYPVKSADLFMQDHFKVILTTLRDEFDYIVIDTAPVLAVVDSTIIALSADVTFLVLGADLHHPEEIILTAKRLEAAGVMINGTIFNNVSKSTSHNSQYRYHYYSNYGDTKTESV